MRIIVGMALLLGAPTPCAAAPLRQIVINEFQADTAGWDTVEFIELYDNGMGNTALDGCIVVLYNGGAADGASYFAISLNGKSTNANGFFVLGAAANVANVDLNVPAGSSGWLQNGADAIALYCGVGLDESNFLLGTACTADAWLYGEYLVDAVVYDTNDDDDLDLLACLGETTQYNQDNAFLSLGRDADFVGSFVKKTPTPGTLNADPQPPPEVQEEGNDLAALIGTYVMIEGAIVTALYLPNTTEGKSSGFYIQQVDVDPTYGILVYTGYDFTVVSVGDLVDVIGIFDEFAGMAQIVVDDQYMDILVTSSSNPIPTPLIVELPVSNRDALEALEGVLVSLVPAPNYILAVSEYFNLGRYGEIVVCSAESTKGRIFQFTQLNAPDTSGYNAHVELVGKSCIEVDDNIFGQNPMNDSNDGMNVGPLLVNKDNILRGGSQVTALTGILQQRTYTSDSDGSSNTLYRLVPLTFEIDQTTNPRPPSPPVVGAAGDGDAVIVVANVFNYFTSWGSSGRGAFDQEEFERQAAKIVEAFTEIDADILGLVEIENKHYDAPLDLASRISLTTGRHYNAATAVAGFPSVGDDAIRVDVLFDTDKYEFVTACRLDDALAISLDPTLVAPIFEGPGTNRVPLAVVLKEDDKEITIVMNHFKSKESVSPFGNNADMGDGAGNNNEVRLYAAKALIAWIKSASFCGGDNVVIAGDLNSYAKEDPIKYIQDSGFTSVKDLTKIDPPTYSYVFDGQWGTLDYVFFPTACFDNAILAAGTWAVNSDEPSLFDYNNFNFYDGNEDAAIAAFYDGQIPFRYSDHDPILTRAKLAKKGECYTTVASSAPSVMPANASTSILTTATFGNDTSAPPITDSTTVTDPTTRPTPKDEDTSPSNKDANTTLASSAPSVMPVSAPPSASIPTTATFGSETSAAPTTESTTVTGPTTLPTPKDEDTSPSNKSANSGTRCIGQWRSIVVVMGAAAIL